MITTATLDFLRDRMVPDRDALSPDFAKRAVRDFRLMADFIHWFNAALDRRL